MKRNCNKRSRDRDCNAGIFASEVSSLHPYILVKQPVLNCLLFPNFVGLVGAGLNLFFANITESAGYRHEELEGILCPKTGA